ncbi:Isoprenoid synthase domain containing protein [Amanita muscaria]
MSRLAKFKDFFPFIRDQLVSYTEDQGMPSEAVDWYRKNLDYNVPHGKLNRGLAVVDSVEILLGRSLAEEEYVKAAVLGWCVELLQAVFLVSDDIMDASITRRSQPCWYRVPEVGMIAINDSFMLEAAIYHLLKTHFKGLLCYGDLVDLFHQTTFQTEMGQLIDLITAPEDNVNLSNFSLKKHRLIVIFKTAYYSFYLPVAAALHLCLVPESYTISSPSGPVTVHPYTTARDILIVIGEYFQIQDDFLDYSGTPEQIGKIGTDIIDNKCSWCINTALARADPAQRQILDENYGRKDAVKEAKVKEVFEELGLRTIYKEYEEKTYKDLQVKIMAIPETDEKGTLKREVFTSFLNKIYKRTK